MCFISRFNIGKRKRKCANYIYTQTINCGTSTEAKSPAPIVDDTMRCLRPKKFTHSHAFFSVLWGTNKLSLLLLRMSWDLSYAGLACWVNENELWTVAPSIIIVVIQTWYRKNSQSSWYYHLPLQSNHCSSLSQYPTQRKYSKFMAAKEALGVGWTGMDVRTEMSGWIRRVVEIIIFCYFSDNLRALHWVMMKCSQLYLRTASYQQCCL